MNIVPLVLVSLSGVSIVVSVVGSVVALGRYLRHDDASLLGFGYADYYYGEMRKRHPKTFLASFGGGILAIALLILAALLR